MRVRIDNPLGAWLLFFFVVVPIFLGSFKANFYTWELRLTAWVLMSYAIYGLFQFYLVQGGSYYGTGILG